MASKAQIQAKALASESKSAGMRLMLENGSSVSEVKEAFGAPYGFVYGVAKRAGLITPEPREAKAAISKDKKSTAQKNPVTRTGTTSKAAAKEASPVSGAKQGKGGGSLGTAKRK